MVRFLIILGAMLFVTAMAGLWIKGGEPDHHRLEITINSQPDRVYRYLIEPELLKKWIGGLVESRPLDGGSPRLGARSQEIIEDNGRRMVIESEITGFEPGRLLESKLTGEWFDVLSSYNLEPGAGGTRLVHTMTASYKGFLPRLMAPLTKGAVSEKLQSDLDHLKMLAESN